MIFSSSARDFWYEAQTSALTYYIEVDGYPIYSGKAVNPSGNARINIGRRVSDYLDTGMPDFRDYDGVVVPHPSQMRVFNLRDEDSVLLGSYTVLLDADGGWTGEYGALTSPVNGHADPRQKLFWTAVEEIETVVADDWYFYPPDHSIISYGTGGTYDMHYSTNYASLIAWSPQAGWLSWRVDRTTHTYFIDVPSIAEKPFSTSARTGVITISAKKELSDEEYFPVCHIYVTQYAALSPGDDPGEYASQYLTFEILSGGTIRWVTDETPFERNISYSLDSGATWTTIRSKEWSDGVPPRIDVSAGQKVLWKGRNSTYGYGGVGIGYGSHFLFDGVMNVYGNISSICQSPIENAFNGLFRGLNIVSAENLVIPYTSIPYRGFESFFSGCTMLEKAPVLPAVVVDEYAYHLMFRGCSSLTETPSLPAISLGRGCYAGMFSYCTSITEAPVLPATILSEGCYSHMFEGCTSLVDPPLLPVTDLQEYCYVEMFEGCTSLTQAPSLPATELKGHCYSKMFKGCTSLVNAPVLRALVLVDYCYNEMFNSCSGLSSVTCLAKDGLNHPEYALSGFLEGASVTGTLYKNPDVSEDFWRVSYFGHPAIPASWTVEDAVL